MKGLFLRCTTVIWLTLLITASLQAASSVTFYHHDALGSVIATSDQNGFVSLHEEYQPYGEKIYRTQDPSSGNEDWYTGKNYSRQLDLSYFGARWYDAKQGRFLSIDPVKVNLNDIHTFNRYAYVGNNPYSFVDPTGESRTPTPIVSSSPAVRAMMKHDTSLAKQGVPNNATKPKLVNQQIEQANSKQVTSYYPSNSGFLGTPKSTTLTPGQTFDRYGGSDVSRFFSPVGTPSAMRSLPPGTVNQPRRVFEVVKPIQVEMGKVAPAFNQIGLGTQYRTQQSLGTLIEKKFVKEIIR